MFVIVLTPPPSYDSYTLAIVSTVFIAFVHVYSIHDQ